MNRLIFIISFLVVNKLLNAQPDKEFWFAIPKETAGQGCIGSTAPCNNNVVSFKVTAMSLDARVTISMPANPAFTPRTFTVLAGQTHIEIMATSWTEFAAIYNNNATNNAPTITGMTNRGILITADNDITVYYDFDNYYNRDLFSLKGKNGLGTEFLLHFKIYGVMILPDIILIHTPA